MLLQLKPLFMGEKESLPLHCELDLSELVIGGSHPFPHPVVVEGEVRVSADVVSLRAEARYLFEGACDRCLRDIRCERLVPVEHILVTSLNNEDNGEFVLVDNYQLPLDSLVEADPQPAVKGPLPRGLPGPVPPLRQGSERGPVRLQAAGRRSPSRGAGTVESLVME